MFRNIGIIIALIVATGSSTTCDDTTTTTTTTSSPILTTTTKPLPLERPFPELFEVSTRKVRIVSESYDEEHGYQTITEYLDRDGGRAAYVTRDKNGMHVTLLNATNDKSYTYKPYTCDVRSQKEVIDQGWYTDNSLDNNLRLFGVTGAWSYATSRPKRYSSKQRIHVVSKNSIKLSHLWSVEDGANNKRIELYFIGDGSKLSLEMVRFVTNGDEPKILKTFNVLSINYNIDQYSSDTFLQVPVGYGCMSDVGELQYDEKLEEDSNLHAPGHSLGKQMLELEVTATRYSNVAGHASDQQVSDTQTIEFARHLDLLLLVRNRNTKSDRKRVVDHKLNVVYDIDMRQGSCKMGHFSQNLDQASTIEIDFANDMKFHLSPQVITDLFDKQQDYKYVKSVRQEDGNGMYVYFERTGSMDVFSKYGSRPIRIIRKFEQNNQHYELISVTIWFLSNDQTHIEEAYYLNIIGTRPTTKKTYDFSEECYLSNMQMREGQNYAWLEFTYPMSNQLSASMVTHMEPLRDELWELYEVFFDARGARLPRLELTLEDDDLKARLLALDLPPFETMFEKRESTTIALDKPEHEDTTVDLRHCADLCRRLDCHLMTFCKSQYKCLYTSSDRTIDRVDPVSRRDPTGDCDSYVDTRTRYESGLQKMISMARRLDYSPVALPKPDDELILPQTTTQIEQAQLDQAEERFKATALDLIKKQRPGLQRLSLITKIENGPVVLVPNGFQVVADPLNEFDLVDSDSSDSDTVPAFHQGLSWSRYSRLLLSDDWEKNVRHFQSLTYDQCAMACTDTKCGSFSYCRSSKDCLTTSINNTAYAQANNLIEQDKDCFIMQRDFLRNFNKFPNVFRPSVHYKNKTQVSNPSECAMECVSQTDYRCLAFDYCEEPTATSQGAAPGGTCYYQSSRHMTNIPKDKTDLQPSTDFGETGCAHYSRSTLAEFIHIESHQIDPSVKDQLDTTEFAGKSLFQCADLCIFELSECSAFEFCLSDQQSIMQKCEMILSKLPESKLADLSAVVDESSNDNLTSVGKLLTISENCHLYALRKDSTEAQLRDLAIGAETLHDKTDAERREANNHTGLTFGKGLLLYLGVTLLSGVLGIGIFFAKNNEFVRQKLERARLLIRP